MDLATREIVGWSMAEHHRSELVVDALKMAVGRARLEPGCIAHADRGNEGARRAKQRHKSDLLRGALPACDCLRRFRTFHVSGA